MNNVNSVEIVGRKSALLTQEAITFVSALHRQFGHRRTALLADRRERKGFDFLASTQSVREGDWKIAPVPPLLADRRVEITGPAEAKMIINALNSGANVFMADLEDSLAPSWENVLAGQDALWAATRKTLTFVSPENKQYRLNAQTATLFVRPRGWHLDEVHCQVDGLPMSASLFDFGLFFFHNAKVQLEHGAGPFFYLPKIESHREARLWNDVFVFAQNELQIPLGTIKATVLIETLPAAFEMDEILYELREHSAGLNCGRWDYIFSFIKEQPDLLLPDRAQLTMDKGFLKAYVQKLIATCHRRGAHAMGGMAAFIPIKNDVQANEEALAKVRADKLREVTDGHDGTWVAHPGLVPVAKAVFDEHMKGPNQLHRLREEVTVSRAQLLEVPQGTRTEAGLQNNIRVGVQYIEAWLRGQGCVPLNNLMEDAATAEICRSQVWQQIRHGVLDQDGLAKQMDRVLADLSGGKFEQAKRLFFSLCVAERFEPFLTLSAYRSLCADEARS
jgi:malate synthase